MSYLGSRLRAMTREPGFTLTGAGTVALAIATAGAVFSIAYCVLVRPLPYEEPERIATVWVDLRALGRATPEVFSFTDLADWREQNRTLASIAGIDGWQPSWSGGGEPVLVPGQAVSWEYFGTLGVRVARGRDFAPGDDAPGAERVVIISDRFWRDVLGGDPSVPGRSLQLSGEPWTVVGVLPAGFVSPLEQADVWRPLRRDRATDGCGRGCVHMRAIARLAPGVTLETAEADLTGVLRAAAERDPNVDPRAGVWLIPLQEQITGDVRRALLVLTGAVGAVLLLACANLSNLLLLRATRRAGESAIRTALGASRLRLAGEMMLDGVLLAGVGGVAGVAGSVLLTRFLVRFLPPEIMALQRVSMSGGIIVATVLLALLTGAAAGLAPALLMSRLDLGRVLRDARQAGRTRFAGVLRGVLAGAQFAFAFLLLFAAALFGRAFLALNSTHLGFDPRSVTYASVVVPPEVFRAEAVVMLESVRAELAALPGVAGTGLASTLPLSGNEIVFSFLRPGEVPRQGRPDATLWFRRASDGYFEAVRRPLVSGRGILPTDGAAAPPVAVISEAAARAYWPGDDPVGQEIRIGAPEAPPTRIVGVVADALHDGPHAPAKAEVFVPAAQRAGSRISIVVRGDGRAVDVDALRAVIRRVAPSLVIGEAGLLETRFADALRLPRLYMWLFLFFGIASVVLAAIGLFGVMQYSVRSSWRELGIRAALGASPATIALGVLRSVAPVVGGGLLVGIGAAVASARVVGSVFVALPEVDPVLPIITLAVLMIAALLGALQPMLAAARVPPGNALRHS